MTFRMDESDAEEIDENQMSVTTRITQVKGVDTNMSPKPDKFGMKPEDFEGWMGTAYGHNDRFGFGLA